MIHFTSDQHYRHKRISQFANRPFATTEEMDEALIESHNRQVAKNDTVWCLGDFCFGAEAEIKAILRRLNGTKRLILGNHDRLIRKKPGLFLGVGLFESIGDYAEVKFEGQRVCLSHYGHRVWNGSHHGSIHLYGHSHGTLPPFGRSMDAGVDSKVITSEYRPVSIKEVIAWAEKRALMLSDYHGKGVV